MYVMQYRVKTTKYDLGRQEYIVAELSKETYVLVPWLYILPSPGFRNRGWGIIAEVDISSHEDQVLNIQTEMLTD